MKFTVLYRSNNEVCHTGCPHLTTLNETSGVITSPSYPRKYLNNQTCSWQITANKGKRVVLIIEDMKIQQRKNCKASCNCDYLEIESGLPSDAALRRRICGNHLLSFFSIRESLKVRFVSDNLNNNHRGFKATYIQVNDTNITTGQ